MQGGEGNVNEPNKSRPHTSDIQPVYLHVSSAVDCVQKAILDFDSNFPKIELSVCLEYPLARLPTHMLDNVSSARKPCTT